MLPTFSKIGSTVVDELSPHSTTPAILTAADDVEIAQLHQTEFSGNATFGGAWGVAVTGYRATHPVEPTRKRAELTEEEERDDLETIARVGRLRDCFWVQPQSKWLLERWG